jgi:hypothetical protein
VGAGVGRGWGEPVDTGRLYLRGVGRDAGIVNGAGKYVAQGGILPSKNRKYG